MTEIIGENSDSHEDYNIDHKLGGWADKRLGENRQRFQESVDRKHRQI